jgi:uncharacterized protein (TIGR02246 family)
MVAWIANDFDQFFAVFRLLAEPAGLSFQWMRRPILLAVVILALALPSAHPQQSADEAAIRALIAHETDGWDKFDAKQVVSTYTEDVIWQNPFGVRIHGRAEMEKFLTNLFARPGYRAGKSTSPAKILELHLTSATTAVVWSDEKIEGLVNDFSGNPMDPRHSYYLEVLVKKDGVWKISDSMIMDIIHPK